MGPGRPGVHRYRDRGTRAGQHGRGTEGAHRAPDGRAFTSDLSGQDFFRLLAAGAVPVAFVLGTCVYHIAHQSAMQSLRQAGRSQEMVIFTQGIYEARELALARMQAEATQARASGIVGVNVAVNNHVWGEQRPNSSPPEPPSGASATSTGSPKPRPSPPSPWGSTASPAEPSRLCRPSGRGRRVLLMPEEMDLRAVTRVAGGGAAEEA